MTRSGLRSRKEAEEIARLANRALREVMPKHEIPLLGVDQDEVGSWRLRWRSEAEITLTIRRAVNLAVLRMEGPLSLVRCVYHGKAGHRCAFVPVIDALLERPCHLAREQLDDSH